MREKGVDTCKASIITSGHPHLSLLSPTTPSFLTPAHQTTHHKLMGYKGSKPHDQLPAQNKHLSNIALLFKTHWLTSKIFWTYLVHNFTEFSVQNSNCEDGQPHWIYIPRYQHLELWRTHIELNIFISPVHTDWIQPNILITLGLISAITGIRNYQPHSQPLCLFTKLE